MKDEIKEILEQYLDSIISYPFQKKDKEYILDYITNLKEENEKVHKDFNELSERYFFTKSRNEKAIEYIKQLEHSEWITFGRKILLNILNGDDE